MQTNVLRHLTVKQLKWVVYFIITSLTVQEIMERMKMSLKQH